MNILVISSSHYLKSRSDILAENSIAILSSLGMSTNLLRLRDYILPPFDNGDFSSVPNYKYLHDSVSAAEALVFASPIYNWGCCAELKKFIEYVGSTPSDGSVRGAFFDKIVTFVNAAGLPHSYMAFASTAISMMLDFKCIINPYNVYVHNRNWTEGELSEEAYRRLEKSMRVTVELAQLLSTRSYKSSWEI